MLGDLFLNELSCQRFEGELAAAQALDLFLRTVIAAKKRGFVRKIRSQLEWYSFQFAENYYFGTWAKSISDRELRRLAIALVANAPAIRPHESDLSSVASGFDFSVGGRPAVGIGLAWLFSGVSVSLSVAYFDAPEVQVRVQELVDGGDRLSEYDVSVHNVSSPEHLDSAVVYQRSALLQSIKTGADLWDLRSQLFPNLSFCDAVEEQIADLTEGKPLFRQVVNALAQLDEYAPSWQGGRSPIIDLPHQSRESDATLRRYFNERTFACPDGESRTFSMHGRLTPGAIRYYYEKFNDTIIVGYIGPKLRTVSDPT